MFGKVSRVETFFHVLKLAIANSDLHTMVTFKHKGKAYTVRFILNRFIYDGVEYLAEDLHIKLIQQDSNTIAMVLTLLEIGSRAVKLIATPAIPVLPKAAPPSPVITPTPTVAASDVVSAAWKEYKDTLILRKKLSNEINPAIERGASQSYLRELYNKIKAFQPELEALYDRARYAERYGKLPEKIKQDVPMDSLASLLERRKSLINVRSKTKKKIENPRTNDSKKQEWLLKLEQLDIEYNSVDLQIKKLQGK